MNRYYIGRFLVSMLVLTIGVAESSAGGKGGNPGGGGSSSPNYSIVALDDAAGAVRDGVARDINNLREVVGYVDDAVGGTGRYAAHWSVVTNSGQTYSTLTVLGTGAANGINDEGEIVGQFRDGNGNRFGAYWADAQALPVELPPLPGHDTSNAQAINDDGVISGGSSINGGGWQSYRAVVWRIHWIGGTPQVFGPVELPGPADGSSAFAVNNNSNSVAEISGVFEATQTAVVWQVLSNNDGSLSVSPTPDLLDTNSQALGINNGGVVSGQRGNAAVVWSGNTTVTLNRPTKGKTAVAVTSAYDISNTGVIVGIASPNGLDNCAVVWQNANVTMLYLDGFLNANSPLLGLSTAEAVNDHGEIVGEGWAGAFIAIPK